MFPVPLRPLSPPVRLQKLNWILSLVWQDLWDLLEIIHVDAHNEQVIQENRNGAGTDELVLSLGI
ncbi:Uncharacterised protein [Escherichia coli]|nr:Uncharacterised protein [Escherichia coli]